MSATATRCSWCQDERRVRYIARVSSVPVNNTRFYVQFNQRSLLEFQRAQWEMPSR